MPDYPSMEERCYVNIPSTTFSVIKFMALSLVVSFITIPGERGRLSGCIWNLGFFPNDARKNCPFVLTAFTGGSSERCPGIGFLRLQCLRETGLILRCDRKVGNPFQTKQGSRPSPLKSLLAYSQTFLVQRAHPSKRRHFPSLSLPYRKSPYRK